MKAFILLHIVCDLHKVLGLLEILKILFSIWNIFLSPKENLNNMEFI